MLGILIKHQHVGTMNVRGMLHYNTINSLYDCVVQC
jgi:hypothetical protein